MQVMKDIGGVEMPEYLARLTSEVPPTAKGNGTAKDDATVVSAGPSSP
jgi:hypothetical protein